MEVGLVRLTIRLSADKILFIRPLNTNGSRVNFRKRHFVILLQQSERESYLGVTFILTYAAAVTSSKIGKQSEGWLAT